MSVEARIREAIDSARACGSNVLSVRIPAGIHRLEKPIGIPAGLGFQRIEIIGEDRERTILCGSVALRPEWEAYGEGLHRAFIGPEMDIDMLYVDGRLYRMARYPDYDEGVKVLQGYAADCLSRKRVARWRDPAGGYFHALHRHRWGDFHFRIVGKDADGTLRMEGGTQNNRRNGLHEEYRYVENILEELDAEGEWFYDRATGLLHVCFEAGCDPRRATLEAVVNDSLVRVVGTEDMPASRVTLKNLTFRHTKRTFMKVAEPLLRSDWCIYRGGALHFENTADCLVEGCDLVDMGSNAVCVNGRNAGFAIRSCLVRDIGGNGICFVGEADCVRTPRFEYAERFRLEEMDPEPGPKSDRYPVDCEVTDCLLTRTGRVEKQTAAVQVSMARRIRISACTIHEVPRAAINFSEGCFGGHVIEDCDLFDTVLETGDHGSFNSWGRDRYWELEDVRPDDFLARGLQHLPYLDAVETNQIRHNRVRCDFGWAIDLDDGSSNYEISRNLCLSGGIKLREGFGRKVWNNITVNDSIHPHVWYRNSGDILRHNVLFDRYKPIRMDVPWGEDVDWNIVHDAEAGSTPRPAVLLQADSGQDSHSVVADCRFADPAQGDFTVLNPEVIRTGFENFDMRGFGVRDPRLLLLAGKPSIPAIRSRIRIAPDDKGVLQGDGMVLRNLLSVEEASAYGAGSTDGVRARGVLLLELQPFTGLWGLGLRPGDILLSMNGRPIHSVGDLAAEVDGLAKAENLVFHVLRDQIERTVPPQAGGEKIHVEAEGL